MKKKLKRILLSNDDGIGSPFLETFLEKLSEVTDELYCIVPAKEKSWIGRAFSRHEKLFVSEEKIFSHIRNLKCYTVNGTPSDCINIALSHIVKDPTCVVSGLNIGQNITLPLLYSSGTMAAAIEGSAFGFPAFACSMQLDKKHYDACRIRHELPKDGLDTILSDACSHAVDYVVNAVQKNICDKWTVHNLNYPKEYSSKTEFVECDIAKTNMKTFYHKDSGDQLQFKYIIGDEVVFSPRITDLYCIENGIACVSKFNIF